MKPYETTWSLNESISARTMRRSSASRSFDMTADSRTPLPSAFQVMRRWIVLPSRRCTCACARVVSRERMHGE
jgi:hypothetical protein